MWQTILQLGSLAGLMSLLLNAIQGTRKRPLFKFFTEITEVQRPGKSISASTADVKPSYSDVIAVIRVQGLLVNSSLDVNTIIRMHLWRKAGLYGHLMQLSLTRIRVISCETNKEIIFPRAFSPRECIRVVVECPIHKMGDVDSEGGDFDYKQYWLVIQDIHDHFFDENGTIHDIDAMSWRLDVPNDWEINFWNGHKKYWGWFKYLIRRAAFFLKRLLIKTGFWR